MSFRDRNRNYAVSQSHPAGYWLAFAVGVIFLAAFVGMLALAGCKPDDGPGFNAPAIQMPEVAATPAPATPAPAVPAPAVPVAVPAPAPVPPAPEPAESATGEPDFIAPVFPVPQDAPSPSPTVVAVAAAPDPVPRAAATTKYPALRDRWRTAKVNPRYSIQLDKLVEQYQRNRAIYDKIEAMRDNGVPSPVLFAFHYRESTNSFKCHPHEGSSLQHRTLYVPKGRPVKGNPPFTFLESAEDAYYGYEKLHTRDWSEPGAVLYWSESFNGLGYMRKGRPSPYVWSGTDQYSRGKYVADGRYDADFVDKQLGVAAILKRAQFRGVTLDFDR